jgi:hypothetical protein
MDSDTHLWRWDKKLFRDAIAVNRFVLSRARRRAPEIRQRKRAARRRKALQARAHLQYIDIYTSIHSMSERRRGRRIAGSESHQLQYLCGFQAIRRQRRAARSDAWIEDERVHAQISIATILAMYTHP